MKKTMLRPITVQVVIALLLVSSVRLVKTKRGEALISQAQIFIDNMPLDDEMKKHNAKPNKQMLEVEKLSKFYENEKHNKKKELLKILKEHPGAVEVKCDENGNPITLLAQTESSNFGDFSEENMKKFKKWLVNKYKNYGQNQELLKRYLEFEKREKLEAKNEDVSRLSVNDVTRLTQILHSWLENESNEGRMTSEEKNSFKTIFEEHAHSGHDHTSGCPLALLAMEKLRIHKE